MAKIFVVRYNANIVSDSDRYQSYKEMSVFGSYWEKLNKTQNEVNKFWLKSQLLNFWVNFQHTIKKNKELSKCRGLTEI